METFLVVFIVNLLVLTVNGHVYPDDVISTVMARFDAQQREIDALQNTFEAQQRQIDAQQNKIDTQQSQIDAHQQLAYKQQRNIDALQNKIDGQQRQIETQEKRIAVQQNKLEAQQQQKSHMDTQQQQKIIQQEMVNNTYRETQRLIQSQEDLNAISKQKQNEFVQFGHEMNGRIRRRQLPVQGTVAFTAVLNHTVANLGVNQNVVFDLVYTNVGDGYDEHQGVFTAPVFGIYAFHTTIFTQPKGFAYCGIFVNGLNKADVSVQGSTVYNAGSQMVVLELKIGDDVAVRSRDHSDCIFSDGDIYPTFSGFLLQDLSDFNGGIVR